MTGIFMIDKYIMSNTTWFHNYQLSIVFGGNSISNVLNHICCNGVIDLSDKMSAIVNCYTWCMLCSLDG